MGWLGKVIGGGLGFIFGGPAGAALGAAAGHYAIDGGDGPSDQEQQQINFLICLLGSIAKFAKVDGVINRAEVQFIDNFIRSELGFEGEMRQAAIDTVNGAKDDEYTPADYFSAFAQLVNYDLETCQTLICLFHSLALCDGELKSSEIKALRIAEAALRLPSGTVDQLLESSGHCDIDIEACYELLSCTPDMSDNQIKQEYRKCCMKFHPDYLNSKELPAEFIAFANEQMTKITSAYNSIMENRRSG